MSCALTSRQVPAKGYGACYAYFEGGQRYGRRFDAALVGLLSISNRVCKDKKSFYLVTGFSPRRGCLARSVSLSHPALRPPVAPFCTPPSLLMCSYRARVGLDAWGQLRLA